MTVIDNEKIIIEFFLANETMIKFRKTYVESVAENVQIRKRAEKSKFNMKAGKYMNYTFLSDNKKW